MTLIKSDGSTAEYYELPQDATELQHLISHKNMNAQIGEIFRACYRYGEVAHSEMLRDAKKIMFYAQAEIERLENISRTNHDQKNPCESASHQAQRQEPGPAETGAYGEDFSSQYES